MRRHFILSAVVLAFTLTSCDDDNTSSADVQTPDNPALIVSPTSITISENGDMQKVTIRLNKMPSAAVHIKAATTDASEFTLINDSASLTYETWSSGFAFYLRPIEDNIADGDQIAALTLTPQSISPEWNLPPVTVMVTVLDSGKNTVDCTISPNDPSCTTPVDCTKTPDDPSCKSEVNCDETPDDPVCQKETVDCSLTPNDPSCPQLPEPVDCAKTPNDPSCPQTPSNQNTAHIRLMAANITSGSKESYDADAGRNIFMAVKPDIVMIQEFKLFKSTFDSFVHSVFGDEYTYFRGTVVADKVNYSDTDSSAKPNGIISRYPIIESGEWQSQYEKTKAGDTYLTDSYYDRQWTWAVIDIPGDRELLVVSVHLHTDNHAKEFNPLAEKIAAKQLEGNYYVALGGDFNTKETPDGRTAVLENEKLMDIFYAKTDEWPVDQNGNDKTNKKRGAPLDWLMLSHDLQKYQTPTEIGTHTGTSAYPNGHVFDSRVYDETGELYYVQPVQPKDSSDINMQHMPVIRDISITY